MRGACGPLTAKCVRVQRGCGTLLTFECSSSESRLDAANSTLSPTWCSDIVSLRYRKGLAVAESHDVLEPFEVLGPSEAMDRHEVARAKMLRKRLKVVAGGMAARVDLREHCARCVEDRTHLLILGRIQVPRPHREHPSILRAELQTLVGKVAQQ